MDELQSTHVSKSGFLEVTYPEEWSGEIDVITNSGNVVIRGKNVEVWSDLRTPLRKRTQGRKGNGASLMLLDTTSGGVDVLVGDAGSSGMA